MIVGVVFNADGADFRKISQIEYSDGAQVRAPKNANGMDHIPAP
jgi:hypothetical protein